MKKRLVIAVMLVGLFCCSCEFKENSTEKKETKLSSVKSESKVITTEEITNESVTMMAMDMEKANINVCKADLNQDGLEEDIVLDLSYLGNSQPAYIKVINSNGVEIFKEEIALEHAGWGTYFLCNENGINYLLKYNDVSGQGSYGYSYEIFNFDKVGNKNIKESKTCAFSAYNINDMNVDEISGFFTDLNKSLGDMKLIISTTDNELIYNFGGDFTNKFVFNKYLDEYTKVAGFENSDTLADKLTKFKNYIIDSIKLSN